MIPGEIGGYDEVDPKSETQRAEKIGDTLDCTPELRHAGRRLIGDTLGMVDASLWISSRRAAGVW
jgi:hypothetical protein